jgi:hypothetical protein
MADPVVLCRCWANGKTSMVLTVDKQLREYLAIQERDVLAFRLVVVEGKRMILGEKLPLWKVAQFKTPQVPPVAKKDG